MAVQVPPVEPTETVAVAFEVPPGPVAVSVYVVVAVGVTETEPLVGCVPMLLSIETEVALFVDQVSVELWPEVIDVGFAVKLMVGADVPELTVTVAVAVAEPPGPVAVSV